MRTRTQLPPPEALAPLARRYELALPTTGMLDLPNLFERGGPLHLEIGTGNGIFLAHAARESPEMNFLGIEREPEFYWKMVKRLDREGIDNARTMRHDAWDVFEALPARCLDRVYCFFSDPWPKRRHARHRVMRTELLPELERLLKPGGEFWFKTDVGWYFNFAVTEFRRRIEVDAKAWEWVERRRLEEGSVREEGVVTNFERKGLEAGRVPWGFKLKWGEGRELFPATAAG